MSQEFNWQPCANITALRQRACLLAKIRQFFHEREVLEVQTPILSQSTVTDPYIQSLYTVYGTPEKKFYLQTSPEFAMKRLLAAGSGSIYQITQAFRNDEHGRYHNPEFTMLEWYRVDWNHYQLMDEVTALIKCILEITEVTRISYAELFTHYCRFDPHTINLVALQNYVAQHKALTPTFSSNNKDELLQLILTHLIEPHLTAATFIYDFPITQAALARIRPDNPPVAERFELYINGIELANGFHELGDAQEQTQRFQHDLQQRQTSNMDLPNIDKHFIAALKHGLPHCSGVALGIDRLLMIACQAQQIREVLSFDINNA
ncbi:MAG: elongation factor P--(R)-beta-lysine ligase [Gammaproteobacteria bacterium]